MGFFNNYEADQLKHYIKVVDKTSIYRAVEYNKFRAKWTTKVHKKNFTYTDHFDTELEAFNNSGDITIKSKGYSVYRGVRYYKVSKKWAATVPENGRTKQIGTYSTELRAFKARKLYIEQNV